MRVLHTFVAAALIAWPVASRAEEGAPVPPKRAVYSLPWGLRPAVPPTVVRLDTAFAFQDSANTVVSTFLAGRKVGDSGGVYVRGAVVRHTPLGTTREDDRVVASNPMVFAIWSPKLLPTLRLPLFAGVALPLGTGGGNDGSRAAYAANSAGIYARSGMDNALFAVNYLTPATGAGIAYTANGLTLQGEATVLTLVRARAVAVDQEPIRVNSTFAAHAGYLVTDWLTLSAEVRHQRFVSTPVIVSRDPARRDQSTALVGARVNVFANGTLLRPGVAYAHPLDAPMTKLGHRVITLDVAVVF